MVFALSIFLIALFVLATKVKNELFQIASSYAALLTVALFCTNSPEFINGVLMTFPLVSEFVINKNSVQLLLVSFIPLMYLVVFFTKKNDSFDEFLNCTSLLLIYFFISSLKLPYLWIGILPIVFVLFKKEPSTLITLLAVVILIFNTGSSGLVLGITLGALLVFLSYKTLTVHLNREFLSEHIAYFVLNLSILHVMYESFSNDLLVYFIFLGIVVVIHFFTMLGSVDFNKIDLARLICLMSTGLSLTTSTLNIIFSFALIIMMFIANEKKTFEDEAHLPIDRVKLFAMVIFINPLMLYSVAILSNSQNLKTACFNIILLVACCLISVQYSILRLKDEKILGVNNYRAYLLVMFFLGLALYVFNGVTNISQYILIFLGLLIFSTVLCSLIAVRFWGNLNRVLFSFKQFQLKKFSSVIYKVEKNKPKSRNYVMKRNLINAAIYKVDDTGLLIVVLSVILFLGMIRLWN